MSIQGDIEGAIVTQLAFAISGIVAQAGPATTPRAEGSPRFGAVRMTTSTGAALEFGQVLWTENYAVTCFWAVTIPRATVIAEWETFESSIATEPQLGLEGALPTVEFAYLSAKQWGEAADGHFRTMSAVVTVERVQ